MNLKLLVFFLLTGFILGCSPNKKKHPNFDQLPAADQVDHTLSLTDSSVSSPERIYDSEDLQQLATITKDSAGTPLYELQEVKIDPGGKVYLTRSNSKAISVFNKEGEFLYTIGRKGKGPGEFLEIKTFEFNSSYTKLYVLERNEIEIFEREGDRFSHVDFFRHKLMFVKDICLLNNDLYISGFKHKKVDSLATEEKPYKAIQLTAGPIQRYDLRANKYISDFGPYYESYSGMYMLDAQLSGMMLSCNESTDTIVGLYDNFAYFFGFTPDGEQKWISRIKDFEYPHLVETKLNTSNPQFKAGPGYLFHPFRETNSKYAISQIHNTQPDMEPQSVILNTETGEIFRAGSTLKHQIVDKNQSMVVSITTDTTEKSSAVKIQKIIN